MYKQDLALNSLQGLICHKIQPTNQLLSLSPYHITFLFTVVSLFSPCQLPFTVTPFSFTVTPFSLTQSPPPLFRSQLLLSPFSCDFLLSFIVTPFSLILPPLSYFTLLLLVCHIPLCNFFLYYCPPFSFTVASYSSLNVTPSLSSAASFSGDACGVMVIVLENGHGDMSSNPG